MKTQPLQLHKAISVLVTLLFLIPQIAASEPIGGIFEQIGTPGNIERTTGEQLTAVLDTDIVSMDNVETQDGRLKIQFVDETLVSMTEHTFIEINEYVYDPDPSKSKMHLTLLKVQQGLLPVGLD